MAAPIFNTVDFSKEIADTTGRADRANLAAFQNLSNTFLTGRQQNINQARQLMSDFEAVINEVDDIHKEGVSEKIQETQAKLARNIYQKKGKSGVRLNLGDLNTSDFNYAREIRSLKNLAANSRLVKQQLTDVKNNIKTDRYILNNVDRANAAADVSTYLSNTEALNQSPEELADQVRTIYRRYRDNVGEAVDIHLEDLVRTSNISVSEDAAGNLITTKNEFYESLFTPNEEGGFDVKQEAIDEVAEKYAERGFIIQAEKEAFKEQLLDKARTVQSQKLQSDALTREARRASIDSAKALADKRAADEELKIAKTKAIQAVDDYDINPFINALQNETGEGRERANFALEGILDGAKVGNIKSVDEYVKYQKERALRDKKFRDTVNKENEDGEFIFFDEMTVKEVDEYFKKEWNEKKAASPDLHLLVIEKGKDYDEVDISNPAGYTQLDGIIKRQAKTKGGKELLSSILEPFYAFLQGRDSSIIPPKNKETNEGDENEETPEEKSKTVTINGKKYTVPIESK